MDGLTQARSVMTEIKSTAMAARLIAVGCADSTLAERR
jgi:hypothetical protein